MDHLFGLIAACKESTEVNDGAMTENFQRVKKQKSKIKKRGRRSENEKEKER